MTIYQLHECGGEYEDYYNRIIGTYLRKERAEEEKAKAEAKEKELVEHSRKCNHCPFLEFDLSMDELFSLYSEYCSEAELEEDKYGLECENYYSHWDESSFYISEVEVEE